MLPRVAFEYRHTWCAVSTKSCATARSSPGRLMVICTAMPKPWEIGPIHGVTLDLEDEGGVAVADQVLVEVNALAGVVSRRRRETGRHFPATHLQPDLLLRDDDGLRGGNGFGFHAAEYTVFLSSISSALPS